MTGIYFPELWKFEVLEWSTSMMEIDWGSRRLTLSSLHLRTLIPVRKAQVSWPNYFSKALSSNIIWELGSIRIQCNNETGKTLLHNKSKPHIRHNITLSSFLQLYQYSESNDFLTQKYNLFFQIHIQIWTCTCVLCLNVYITQSLCICMYFQQIL